MNLGIELVLQRSCAKKQKGGWSDDINTWRRTQDENSYDFRTKEIEQCDIKKSKLYSNVSTSCTRMSEWHNLLKQFNLDI